MGSLMRIGDLANETGLSVDTIRFYEREGLLHPVARSSGGFRLFSASDLEDLTFIRNAQELGFSLEEIREFRALKQTSKRDCEQVEQLLEHKIEIVRGKIASLRRLERELERAAADCKSNLRRAPRGKAGDCPVLAEISSARWRQKK